MEREKLLEEYAVTLASLVEKTKFVYSEEFYALDEFEKQKYNKDKMATEAHLGTLCNVLWSKIPQISSVTDMFGLAILSSMFGSSFGSTMPLPKLDEKEIVVKENENKPE